MMDTKKLVRKTLVRVAPNLFLMLRYRRTFGFFPDLKNPGRFTEKVIYRMIYDHDPRFTRLSDKVAVREWIREMKVEQTSSLFPECYGIWDSVEEIDFEKLPSSFVLKSNHASGHIILCPDKDSLDREAAKRTMRHWLKINYYYEHAERQYKDISPKIICEQLLDNNITDYRCFCFRGKVGFIRVTSHDPESPSGYSANAYTSDWEKVDIRFGETDYIKDFERPQQLTRFVGLAQKLSEDFDFVRVDLYNVNNRIYLAEMTFTPNGGGYRIIPDEWDYRLGEMFDLQKK